MKRLNRIADIFAEASIADKMLFLFMVTMACLAFSFTVVITFVAIHILLIG